MARWSLFFGELLYKAEATHALMHEMRLVHDSPPVPFVAVLCNNMIYNNLCRLSETSWLSSTVTSDRDLHEDCIGGESA